MEVFFPRKAVTRPACWPLAAGERTGHSPEARGALQMTVQNHGPYGLGPGAWDREGGGGAISRPDKARVKFSVNLDPMSGVSGLAIPAVEREKGAWVGH